MMILNGNLGWIGELGFGARFGARCHVGELADGEVLSV